MKILPLKKDNYNEWNKFCFDSDDAWFWHTTKWIEQVYWYGKEKFSTKNISFFIKDDSRIIAICPLFIERRKIKNEDITQFSSEYTGFSVVPALGSNLSIERKDKVKKIIFNHLNLIAEDNNIKISHFRMNPLAKKPAKFNWLVKFGYLDASINTQIIDLSLSEEKLWSRVRKGHRYDINRGKNFFEVAIFDSNNIDKRIFNQYSDLHFKASGKKTRHQKTFDIMYDDIVAGNGILCGIKKNQKYVGFSYVNIFKSGAYYSSACDDPDYKNKIPISHIIQWKIILWLKQNDFCFYEIGHQYFGPSIFGLPTSKDLSISLFKRGFGGETVPLFRGVKYYDDSIMMNDLNNKISLFSE